ncbi:MAG TPA: hypothetical protein VFB14_13515 [Bryobacteraceae bacterium]|nr:hypothetical protein [Bryobacteraceae bacterium]
MCCFALSALLPAFAGSKNIPKLDRAWKHYRNSQWGYCVSYPSRWLRGDAFDGAGLFVETGIKKFSNPLGEIDVAALPALAGAETPASAKISLSDIVKVQLDGLRKFEHAERMVVLETREIPLADSKALFTKERYYDPQERATWIGEIIYSSRKSVLYRLELTCRMDQLARFEPVFTRVLSTFQFECSK